MTNSKLPLIVVGVLLIVLIAGVSIFALNRRSAPTVPSSQEQAKKKKSEPTNVIALADRPYIQLVPSADGRNIQLVVNSLKKPATEVEFEIEYQDGTQIQGLTNLLKIETLPAEFKFLLGTCSAGGKCSYHEDVRGGSLLTKFKGAENYALKSDWRFINNATKETAISSKDGKLQLEASSLSAQRYLIVFNTAGYPLGLVGTPVSDPYSLTSGSALSGTGTLTLRTQEEGSITIMGWNGQAWKSFATTVAGRTAIAEVELMELYIAVKQ